MSWTEYDDVESDPEKMSGAIVLKGTRVPVDAIINNYDSFIEEGLTPQEAALATYSLFPSVTERRIHAIVAFCNAYELEVTS